MGSGFIILLIIIVGFIFINKRIYTTKNKSKKEKQSQKTYSSNYEKYSGYTKSNIDFHDYTIDLFAQIRNDFVRAPYVDKILIEPSYIIGYRFEDGRTVKISKLLKLEETYKNVVKSAKLTNTQANVFMAFFRQFAELSVNRPGGYNRNNQTFTEKSNYTPEQIKYQEMYYKLKEVNDLRMTQLNKMSKIDPDRPALVNEVNVVKRKMKSAFLKSGLKIK